LLYFCFDSQTIKNQALSSQSYYLVCPKHFLTSTVAHTEDVRQGDAGLAFEWSASCSIVMYIYGSALSFEVEKITTFCSMEWRWCSRQAAPEPWLVYRQALSARFGNSH